LKHQISFHKKQTSIDKRGPETEAVDKKFTAARKTDIEGRGDKKKR
jgi:hypothetical protein